MRLLLALLSFLALSTAPLAGPAAALNAPAETCGIQVAPQHDGHHPAKGERSDQARCCLVPAAALASVSRVRPAPRIPPANVGLDQLLLEGIIVEGDDPPPRTRETPINTDSHGDIAMNKLLTAIALSVALPTVAHAQAAPVPVPEKKMDCCEKMKAEGKECCCKDMDKGHAEHGDKDKAESSHEHKS
jgi:hypothetical protein